jgi:hypothetical protein
VVGLLVGGVFTVAAVNEAVLGWFMTRGRMIAHYGQARHTGWPAKGHQEGRFSDPGGG